MNCGDNSSHAAVNNAVFPSLFAALDIGTEVLCAAKSCAFASFSGMLPTAEVSADILIWHTWSGLELVRPIPLPSRILYRRCR